MATIKLGMLVTQIAGSIGGTTFRRAGNAIIMQNKTKGASKNRLLANTALQQLSTVVKGWLLLSDADRAEWNAQALNYQFTDKFGDLKYLTGRQLYIKLTNTTANNGEPSPDPATLAPLASYYTANGTSFAPSDNMTLLSVSFDVAQIVAIQVELLKNTAISPSYTRRKILKVTNPNVLGRVEFNAEFLLAFPNWQIGESYRVYYFTQNESGFRSVSQSIVGIIV